MKLFKRKPKQQRINILIQNTKYTLPTVEEITVGQYINIFNLLTTKDQLEFTYDVLKILIPNIPIENADVNDIFKIYQHICKLLVDVNKIYKQKDSITINNYSYNIINKLGNVSGNEFLHINSLMSEQPLPYNKIAAVLYRPKGEKYDGDKIISRYDEFLNAKFIDVSGVLSFFLKFANNSLASVQNYLEDLQKVQTK